MTIGQEISTWKHQVSYAKMLKWRVYTKLFKLASKLFKSKSNSWVEHPWIETINPLHLGFMPWIMIHSSLYSLNLTLGSNWEISQVWDFTSIKYWLALILPCITNISSFYNWSSFVL